MTKSLTSSGDYTSSTERGGYRADIDGLRAIAILLVVIFHFDILSAGHAGFIGVDVFFVISGFLITGIVARDLEAGQFRLGEFFYRRIRRLYPALLATLLLYLAFACIYFLPAQLEEIATEALLSQLYVVNIYFWRSVNYFGFQADDVPLLHMWSLAVEEQFYLIFPIFCLVVHRMAPHRLLPAIAGAGILSFCLGLFASGWSLLPAADPSVGNAGRWSPCPSPCQDIDAPSDLASVPCGTDGTDFDHAGAGDLHPSHAGPGMVRPVANVGSSRADPWGA